MQTKHIETALRAATSPAAKLAAWQAKPAPRRLSEIRAHREKSYYAGETLAQSRAACIASQGPELSSPENPEPILWVSDRSPEVLDAFPGRDFLDHCGWYTMEDGMDGETFETYAVQLARFPGIMFYALKDSCNDDLRVMLADWEEIDFSDAESEYQAGDCITEAARSVVRSNDSSTEREAEDAREFYRKDQAERDIAENRETLAGLRSEIRDLCRELKTLCPSPMAGEYPAAGKALRRALAGLLSDRRELMDRNSELSAAL